MNRRHTWHQFRGGNGVSCGLGQNGHGQSGSGCASGFLLGHLVVSGIEVFLSLGQSLLKEGGVAPRGGGGAAHGGATPSRLGILLLEQVLLLLLNGDLLLLGHGNL